MYSEHLKYAVKLSVEERAVLEKIVERGTGSEEIIKRASILLASDIRNKKYMSSTEIAKLCRVDQSTVFRVRRFYCERGVEGAIYRKKSDVPSSRRKATKELQAQLIALTQGPPPEGYSRWTYKLLTDRINEMGRFGHISSDTTRKALGGIRLSKKRQTTTAEMRACVVELASGPPPEGCRRWTQKLLAEKMVELGYAEHFRQTTVSRVLKKANIRLHDE